MHPSIRRRRGWAATSATLALLATSAVAAAPALAQATAPTTLRSDVPDDPADKLSAAVQDQLTDQKSADFWIRMDESADLAAAEQIADWDERGQYVYDTLTSLAKKSQADVIDTLDAAGASYTSYWINNSIYVDGGTLALAQDVAQSDDVTGIYETFAMEETDPVETKPANTKVTTAVEWGIDAINAPEVWDLGVTGQGITVASFDTGVDVTHPALRSKYRGIQPDGSLDNDYNWFDIPNACGGDPCASSGSHGTHTTGTMVGSDGADQVGVAPGATWIAANCIDLGECDWDDYLADAQWFLAPTRADGSDPDPSKRPHIINNSWGIPAGVDLPEDWMSAETQAWNAAGIFGAWAAGNEGPACSSGRYPGEFSHTYAAGAFDADGDIASFSARGPGRDDAVKPDIAAPGVDVRSSVPGGYGTSSGTSMATPHLAGAVALLWSAAPALRGDVEGTAALLDRTAVDVEDTTCGGTADDNNVWGEGKLDALALVDAAPTADTGDVTGTVTDGDGDPVAGAEVAFDGTHDRTVTTGEDGTFSARLAAGDYAVTASAFGFVDHATDVTVTADETVTLPITLERAPTRTVSGTVTERDGSPTAGAVVALSAPLDDVTTDADGRYAIAGVPDGTYTLSVTAGNCAEPYSTELVVDGDETADAVIDRTVDAYGYSCTTGTAGVATGDTLLELTGDDKAAAVELPFSFPFYGADYGTAYVSTNGFLNFLGASTSLSNVALPAAGAPNAAVYPFWDDLNVDAESAVYTASTTVDGVDAFVVEWRNVRKYRPDTDRVNVSATLLADGRVTLGYGAVTDSATARGESATIGIEDADGAVASQYSYNAPVVSEGLSITYDLVDMGTVQGVVRDGNTREPIEGATVTITSKDDGDETVVTTGADGAYAARLPLERYGLTYAKDEYAGAARNARLTEDGQVLTRNVALGAGRLEVNKEGVSATLAMGGTVSRAFRLTNTGTEPVDVSLGAGSGGFEMLATSATGGGVISHVTDAATVPGSTSPGTPRLGADKKGDGLTTSGADAATVSPDLSAVVALDETTLTHSASQDIVSGNSLACSNPSGTQDNAYLRTFTLSDFGIGGSFDVSAVSFGVEAAGVAQPLTVNLYTLEGDLGYANMTPVGSAEATVEAGADGTMVTVPVTGEVPQGGTLVVEVDVPAGGRFFIGSNDAGQTAPSYLRSEACDLPEPADTADIGAPGMHVVMNVSGEASGGGVEWLDVQPPELTLAPGASVQAAVTLDAAVEQPGTYTAAITVGENTPYAAPQVGATMTVRAPAGWGKITGTITGDGTPLDGAVVHLDGKASDTTLVTGADGRYAYWMPKANGPLRLVVAANGFVPTVRTAQIVAGQTTVYDVDLKPLP
ncbi:carboxypeptidase regulatory-like domain-containing protein [Isoptericola sp. NPDC057391]|uniref:carboxypeptidase regulatory-like domain-containing protein n=1 Tax=Isoptericola sp. NPDC057391 TaxID=3346117 RepID=UPI003642CB34